MFGHIFRFELQQQTRQGLFLITLFFFFLLSFVIVTTEGASVGGAAGNVHRNAPYVILQLLGTMTIIGLFLTTAFVANTTVRDVETGTAPLFFSTRIKKSHYLFGRFGGALTACILASLAVVLAIIIGSWMPWIDPKLIGPFQITPYLYSLGVVVIPNLLIAGAIFFAVSSLTRSMWATYIALVIFFFGWGISQIFLQDLDTEAWGIYLDPFGLAAIDLETRYWTVFERNTMMPPLDGPLLLNRLLWVGIALAVLIYTYRRFRFEEVLEGGKRSKQVLDEPEAAPQTVAMPEVAPRFTHALSFRQLARQTAMECAGIIKSVPFVIMLSFGMINLIMSTINMENIFGTGVYPTTGVMLNAVQGTFNFLLVIILLFYAGEAVWRERSQRLHEVYGALPMPNWVPALAKLAGLFLVAVAFLTVGMVTCMIIQAAKGYTRFEPGLYLKGIFAWQLYPFLLLGILAFFLQVVARNKFLGYLLMILFLVVQIIMGALNFEHRLYNYADLPGGAYSDLNGYGHFVQPWLWLGAYWGVLATALVILSVLFWQRGTDLGFGARWSRFRERLTAPAKLALASLALVFVATGAFIFYNTNILNRYVPTDVAEKEQAEYEKIYKAHRDLPQPKIYDVYNEVDIYPEDRRIEVKGRYLIRNRSAGPLQEVHITMNPQAEVVELKLPSGQLQEADELYGHYVYQLSEPMAVGATSRLDYVLRFDAKGFVNRGPVNQVVANGTFFNSGQFFPSFGYSQGRELGDNSTRRKHGLEPVVRMAKLGDEAARQDNMLSPDADWIAFETVVSTAPDQIAVAPGYLEREWEEGERRYFHYKMDRPMVNFYAYLSARYEVKRDRHGDVAIEIFHHPNHDFNVDRMIDSIKKSLTYFEENFSPFQFRQMRILEFPRYASFAQSFANTVPFSESIGFIADLRKADRNEEDIDYVFYVTAHEVAHQWWGHQALPAPVQGATLVVETMAQYSALMVMEQEYGREKMRRFLRYELDRYLRGRGSELIEELPLKLVENQAYIHYRKGSLVLYALRDYLGEDVVNRAMAKYLEAVAFEGPPYTVGQELVDFVRAEAPAEHHGLIDDLFERITIYDNRIEKATYSEAEDGRYKVQLSLAARKLYADGEGKETEAPLDDWVDIGIFGRGEDGEEVLYLEKHRLQEGDATLELLVDAEPREVGVDPFNKLIDRNPEDNRKIAESVGP